MCEFISWIEKDGSIFYLTYHDIYRTKKGKELRDYCKNNGDLVGHGSTRYYYDNFTGGINKECTDFSNSNNFPKEIVNDIKLGKFRGLGIKLDLLNNKGKNKYDKAIRSAYDKCDKIIQFAKEEYYKAIQSAYEKYNKIKQSAREEYDKIVYSVRKEYDKIIQCAREKYNKIEQSAHEEYYEIEQSAYEKCNKIIQSAYENYDKIEQTIFWDLFTNINNRNKAWK